MSLQTIHSATPDTAFSAPQSPLPYFVFCFLSSFLLLFLPSPSPLLLSSCPPGSCSLKWQPQWLILCVMSAAGATWDQPWGQRGLQHRRAGVDVPVECGGGVRAASCGRGRHLLHSCRWSHRGWGGLWRCSGPLTDGFVLEGNKSERKKGDFFLTTQGNIHDTRIKSKRVLTCEWLQQHLGDRVSIVQPILQHHKPSLAGLRVLTTWRENFL